MSSSTLVLFYRLAVALLASLASAIFGTNPAPEPDQVEEEEVPVAADLTPTPEDVLAMWADLKASAHLQEYAMHVAMLAQLTATPEPIFTLFDEAVQRPGDKNIHYQLACMKANAHHAWITRLAKEEAKSKPSTPTSANTSAITSANTSANINVTCPCHNETAAQRRQRHAREIAQEIRNQCGASLIRRLDEIKTALLTVYNHDAEVNSLPSVQAQLGKVKEDMLYLRIDIHQKCSDLVVGQGLSKHAFCP